MSRDDPSSEHIRVEIPGESRALRLTVDPLDRVVVGPQAERLNRRLALAEESWGSELAGGWLPALGAKAYGPHGRIYRLLVTGVRFYLERDVTAEASARSRGIQGRGERR